jgi:NAD(P)-dependent dehydrogenase (short-subunit alcohol dehydrogenase family)
MHDHPGTVLVTGAGRRLGRTIALDFAKRGWRVGVHCRTSPTEAADLVAEIGRNGGKAAVFVADLAQLDALGPLVEACAEALGGPTCLINNAARYGSDSLTTVDAESWQGHIDVNLRAPIFLAQAFAKALPKGETGNVINLIDQKVLRLDPEYFSYTIAKAALWTATQTMAQALAPRVRVNAIAPGPVLKSEGQTQAAFERECQATLLQRAVDEAELTAAIRFLLDTPSITGQMIALDAGQHLAWQGKDGGR